MRPVDVQPIAAGPGEKVVVDQSVVIIDSSSSVRSEFPTEKALSQSLVSSMPAGDYKAGAIQFGGVHRNVYPVGTFDRSGMAGYAADMSQIGEGTPIYNSFDEAAGALASVEGHTAVTVISDGVFTDVGGRPVSDESVMAAARGLASKSNGEVCFHTVQVGSDKEGAENLQKLANLTDCGSFRPASSLTTASAIQSFQREVYLAAAPKPVAKAVPGDADGDGVLDNSDQCPNTPRGARVDPRGCWVPADIFFALNSDKMDQTSKELLLQRGMPILKQNPDLRVRIDGYTDSSGTEAYNQQLSQRRAEAVRKFFIDNGIAPGRLEARGFGESNPAYPNDSPANMAKNRRVEFTPL